MTNRTRTHRQKALHAIDVRVLEGLALYDPRNIASTAVKLDMKPGTLHYRINYLRSHFSLALYGSVYHTNIGLRKVIVFAEPKPGYEELLYQCLKSNDYWLCVSQCMGAPKCLAIYGVPAGKEEEFEEFLSKVNELDQINDIKFYWSTCFQNVNAKSMWFDSKTGEWVFPWDSWLEEVLTEKGELPYTLKDPDAYVQKADRADIIILKELEKNCTVNLKEIAKMLGISSQAVKYHFKNHVIKERMFEGQQIVADHYKGLSADTHYFRFDFKNYENLAKFACSLLDKPFVRVVGKVYGKNQLFVQIYLPRGQLGNFLKTLSKLVRTEFLDTYEYMIQDLTKQRDRQFPTSISRTTTGNMIKKNT